MACTQHPDWGVIRRGALDLLLYLSVLALLLAIYTHLVPPAAGHYNCSDPSIWLPRKPDTVSTKILIILVFAAFFVFVVLAEVTVCAALDLGPAARLRMGAASTGATFLVFFLGLTWTVCVNLVIKTLTAVPRPHFIATCRPDWEAVDCGRYKGNVQYNISHCQVAPEDQGEVLDAMKSFPSGHAQISCFTAVFLIVHLQRRLVASWAGLWRAWLQLAALLLAAASSASRVTDHRHHAADVWAGAALGAITAAAAALQLRLPPPSGRAEDKKTSPIGLLGWTAGSRSTVAAAPAQARTAEV